MRADRKITKRGGHGFDILLNHTGNTAQVYWTRNPRDGNHPYNSYVTDGTDTWSINGIGEIRWKVERWNPEYEETRAYFGLGRPIDRRADLIQSMAEWEF